MYVGMRYYKAELLGWLRPKGTAAAGASGGNNGAREGSRTPKAPADQAELFVKNGSEGRGNEQFQQMQRAIGVIRQVIAQGIENKLDRENLLDHIREVLSGFDALRKTEYADTINNFLMRTCSSELSLQLGEKELQRLWK
jgi:hypothetical protein